MGPLYVVSQVPIPLHCSPLVNRIRASGKIHDTCQHDDNCTASLDGSRCENNTCQCVSQLIDKYNECVPR